MLENLKLTLKDGLWKSSCYLCWPYIQNLEFVEKNGLKWFKIVYL